MGASGPIRGEVELGGRDTALLVAALFMLVHWDFTDPGVKGIVAEQDDASKEELRERVSREWRERLMAEHLWEPPGGTWTRELLNKRGALERGVRLQRSDLALSIRALMAVEAEFSNCWGEFCVAAPGNVDWYDLRVSDVVSLAHRLEATLRAA
jgi:hypothetical protein